MQEIYNFKPSIQTQQNTFTKFKRRFAMFCLPSFCLSGSVSCPLNPATHFSGVTREKV